jgi:hypothetical protein
MTDAAQAPETDTTKARKHNPLRVVGGRITRDNPTDLMQWAGAGVALIPPDAENSWRVEKLDQHTFERMPAHRVLELLCDLSPDISRALWDWLRMCNPGWACKTYTVGTQEINMQAQVAVDAFVATLKDLYGDFNIIPNRLFTSVFLRGAVLSELIIAPDGRTPLDLATPDPRIVRFEKVWDARRGTIYRPYEQVRGERVYLDLPTITYIPVDPFPGSPYGRALATPALFPTMFLLTLLHDVRRVVQQQGYPRHDITILLEKLEASMPDDLEEDDQAFEKWVTKTINDVSKVFNNLQPDEAYIHTDVVQINRPVGTVDASSLQGVQGIVEILERMIIRALKTVAIVMGFSVTVSESNANRQWEIFAAGIKAIQHLVEVLFERVFTFMLRAQGIAADVEFRFSELRTAELLRDTQVELLMTKVATTQYQAGFISQDEAALKAANKQKADQQEPRAVAPTDTTGAGAVASAQPDPGALRALVEKVLEDFEQEELLGIRTGRRGVIPTHKPDLYGDDLEFKGNGYGHIPTEDPTPS